MTKLKLKDWVLPALGLFVLTCSLVLYYVIANIVNHDMTIEDTYVTDAIIHNTIDVNNEIQTEIIKPYQGDKVSISKYYYDRNDDSKKQEKSLIRYQNIYMPNTGILYSSDNEFEIVAIYDGKITNIKEDKIMGNIIEIEHDNGYHTIYQSIKDITVKVGDPVKTGDILGKSGSNKLENEKDNCLHFEVYKEGTLINPETIIPE